CPMFLGHITGEPMKQGVQNDGPARVPSIRGLIVTPTLARFVLSEIAYDLWVTHSAPRGNAVFDAPRRLPPMCSEGKPSPVGRDRSPSSTIGDSSSQLKV